MAAILNSTPLLDVFTWVKKTAKFHPDPIWNDGDLGFLYRWSPQQQQEQKEQDE